MPRVLIAAVALGFALAAPRAGAWPVERGPSREPAAYRYDAKALAAVPRAYLDSAVAAVLYAGSSYRLEPDGSVETVTHEVTRLNGRKGIERLGEYRGITYAPSYQKLTLHEARIHKASGQVVPVEPHHVQLRDVATDFQVYDPEKQLVISFPGLEVGDTIEVRWTIRGKNPEHDGQFFQRYSFGDTQYPVALDELRVCLPRDRQLKHACVNGRLVPTIRDQAGERLYLWRTVNRPQPPRDDHLPSREELRPTVLLSTFADWKQVGRWKEKLRRACWNCPPEVRRVAETVAKAHTAPLDKARALTYWVRRNIRYVSTGERHDYTPHLPAKVLANRFGDCKDTSQLLAVLLREVGIRVELATLGARDDGQIHPDVPSPWGTHAILLVTLAGKEHWIDTTAALSAWDFLPRDDLDRVCYLTDEKGNVRLHRTPPADPAHHRVEVATDVEVRADGTSRCRRVAVAHGSAAVVQRDLYLETPPGERRRLLASELQDAHSRTRLVRLTIDDKALGDFDRPVQVRSEFEIPRHFSGAGELEGSVTDSTVWGRLLAYTIDHDRTVPLVLRTPFESIHVYRFHAPVTHTFDGAPRPKTIRSAWGSFRVESRVSAEGGEARSLELTFHTRLEGTRVEPGDLEAFRRFHEEVNRDYRVWVYLRPVRDLAAAPRLEKLLAAAPDLPAATTLARLYLGQRRLADARRVLDAALTRHPDDAELGELRVRAAETPEDEEAARRRLTRQQPDDPEHRLALATLLVSRGKQADARALLTPLAGGGPARVRARAQFQLARSHYRQDELPQALAQLEAAGKTDPGITDTLRYHVLHGQVLEELKRPADAARAYRKALERDRASLDVLLSLVRLYLAAGDELAALDHLRQYTLLVRGDVTGLLLAAETYFVLKRYDEATELALQAREIGFHEKAQRLLGLVALARGDYPRALQHLSRAETDAVVLAGLIEAHLATGTLRGLDVVLEQARRPERSSTALRQAVEHATRLLQRRAELGKRVTVPPDKADAAAGALDALASAELAHARRRPVGEVETLLNRAMAAGIDLAPAYRLRARLALERGQLRRAGDDATRAIGLCADEGDAYLVRGRVRLERGDKAALTDLERAVKLTGRTDVEALTSLAEALETERQYDAALRTLREAIRLRPKDATLAERLRRLEAARRGKQAG